MPPSPLGGKQNTVDLLNAGKASQLHSHGGWPMVKTLALKWLSHVPGILGASQLPASVPEPWKIREGWQLELGKLEWVDEKRCC